MVSINEISEKIRDVCYDVDKNITGLSDEDARPWAQANSIRHAYTISAILEYHQSVKKDRINILNASGISCGHQDFSIADYLQKSGIKYDWKVYESPGSRFLGDKNFKNYLKELDIDLEISDFARMEPDKLYGENNKEYDVVLFTEIAEHLDHSTLLNSLTAINRKLKDDGLIILTTPNLVSLPNRIRILFGNGTLTYDGDGTRNLEKGIYGHIVYYDQQRLRRLLNDTGFTIDKAFTFNYGEGRAKGGRRAAIAFNDFLTYFFKNMRSTIFISARKSKPVKIPLVLPSQV